jgi:Ca2+-binding RTX toxin-like protein
VKSLCCIEPIERRRLLSASINSTSNLLEVSGTAEADLIRVVVLDGFTRVSVNDEPEQMFDSTKFQAVSIAGEGGDDDLSLFDAAGGVHAPPTVHGGAGDDVIAIDRDAGSSESGGDAYYFGGAGDDTFTFLRILTNRIFKGGSGIDSVSYGGFSTVGGIQVKLDGLRNDGPNGADNIGRDVEVVTGTVWNDTLVGNGGDQTLRGNVGDDWLDGAGGRDFLGGDAGDDTLVGSGDDTLVGGEGRDAVRAQRKTAPVGTFRPVLGGMTRLFGDAGNDLIRDPRVLPV